MTNQTHKITVRRYVKVPRETVFGAFTTAEALTQWFSPSPDISVEVLTFQFEVGHQYRFRYTMQDGSNPVLGGVYDLISEPDELAFTWVWEAPDAHANIPTRVHIQFLSNGVGTEIVLTHEQLPSEDAGKRHAEGWEGTLDNLERAIREGQFPLAIGSKRGAV